MLSVVLWRDRARRSTRSELSASSSPNWWKPRLRKLLWCRQLHRLGLLPCRNQRRVLRLRSSNAFFAQNREFPFLIGLRSRFLGRIFEPQVHLWRLWISSPQYSRKTPISPKERTISSTTKPIGFSNNALVSHRTIAIGTLSAPWSNSYQVSTMDIPLESKEMEHQKNCLISRISTT